MVGATGTDAVPVGSTDGGSMVVGNSGPSVLSSGLTDGAGRVVGRSASDVTTLGRTDGGRCVTEGVASPHPRMFGDTVTPTLRHAFL